MQPELYSLLSQGSLQSFSPGDAIDAVALDKAVLVDVRLGSDFEKVHAEGAIGVPLFQPISGFSPKSVLKSLLYASQGIQGVEENPDFVSEVVRIASDKAGKTVILMCDSGGTAQAVPGFLYGKQSRSLQAAFKAAKEGGLDNLGHLEGGLLGYGAQSLPLEGSDTEAWKEKAGRTI